MLFLFGRMMIVGHTPPTPTPLIPGIWKLKASQLVLGYGVHACVSSCGHLLNQMGKKGGGGWLHSYIHTTLYPWVYLAKPVGFTAGQWLPPSSPSRLASTFQYYENVSAWRKFLGQYQFDLSMFCDHRVCCFHQYGFTFKENLTFKKHT